MNTKQLTAKVKDLKEEGSEGIVTVVFATLNVVDKDGDVTLPGAFGEQTAVILPAHDWNSVALGKAFVKEVGNEAIAVLKYNLSIPAAKDWFLATKFDMENGPSVQEYSYGFTVKDSESGIHEGERVNFLKDMQVHEVSPVLVGAGEHTRTLSMKGKKEMSELEKLTGQPFKGVIPITYLKHLATETEKEFDDVVKAAKADGYVVSEDEARMKAEITVLKTKAGL